ncbi:hypothetical protein [Nocardia amamiensis]|uniref:hypothetical protein n=1 Tax=Nocardia amamiensis TaxID=404578 RepID=UPI0008316613|nr:hypothetical protein [Nocardia amamiensis]
MPDELVNTLLIIATVLALLWLPFEGLPGFLDRREKATAPDPDSGPGPAESDCHPAPVVPFTVAQARIVMQKLIRCDAERCDCKAVAFRTLVEAGLVKPARDLK